MLRASTSDMAAPNLTCRSAPSRPVILTARGTACPRARDRSPPMPSSRWPDRAKKVGASASCVAARHLLGQTGGGGSTTARRLGVDARRHIGADQAQRCSRSAKVAMGSRAAIPLLLPRAIAELAARPRRRTDGGSGSRCASIITGPPRSRIIRRASCMARRTATTSMPSHLDGGDAQHGAAGGEPRLAGLFADMGRDGVEIILEEEDDRQAIERGDVHRLIGGPAISVPSPKNATETWSRPRHLVGQRIARRMGQIAADDGAGAGNARPRHDAYAWSRRARRRSRP